MNKLWLLTLLRHMELYIANKKITSKLGFVSKFVTQLPKTECLENERPQKRNRGRKGVFGLSGHHKRRNIPRIASCGRSSTGLSFTVGLRNLELDQLPSQILDPH